MSQNSFFICIYQPRYSIQNTFSFPKSMQNFCPHAFKSKNRAKVLGINRNMKTGMIFLNKQKAKGKGQKAKGKLVLKGCLLPLALCLLFFVVKIDSNS